MKKLSWRSAIGLVTLVLVVSCSSKPQPIEYGKDQCSFCVMNIVDNSHAAQYVTKKGKQFKFDAIECMVMAINEKDESEMAIILVANYALPGEMINASDAIYLISPEIKSPMGANLSAVDSQERATELVDEFTGDLYSWVALKEKFLDR